MNPPSGWTNPIRVSAGQMQAGISAADLLPSRGDLMRVRLDQQRLLRRSQIARHTPIQVTVDGVIWDGHHAVRVAAEEGARVDVLVLSVAVAWSGKTTLQLPVR
jgi:hypothetical protein